VTADLLFAERFRHFARGCTVEEVVSMLRVLRDRVVNLHPESSKAIERARFGLEEALIYRRARNPGAPCPVAGCVLVVAHHGSHEFIFE
jgi:hypothetical protein